MTGLTAAHITAALKAAGAGGGLVMPAGDIAAAFNDAILGYGGGQFDTADQVAALVSESMMESAYFRTLEEYAKDGPYAPFIGRTFIQITWKANYAAFGAWCKTHGLLADADWFVDQPARLADRKWAALGAVWYFTQVQFAGKPLTAYAGNIAQVGKAVNLGNPYAAAAPNGQRAREAAYKAVRALGSSIVPQEAPVPIPFRGAGLTCACVVESLPWVELDLLLQGLIHESVDIYQLGYRNDVAASAGTHAGGGNTDVAQFSDAQIRVWRKWGWTIQHRTRAQGFDMDHGHGWPLGCPHLSAGGRAQAAQWANRQNGLVSRGPISGPYTTTTWKTALKENKMALLDDITAATTKGVLAALAKDGTVNIAESQLTGNPKNKDAAVATALDYIGRRLMTLRGDVATKDDLAKLSAKIDALKPASKA